MRLVLRKKCCTSWIEWHLPNNVGDGDLKKVDTALLT